jgi:hypothetical protein
MFGLGRSDNNQRAAVEKFKQAMVPLRGGYVYRLKRGGDAVLLSEQQRDILLDYYAKLLNRSMGLLMLVLVPGFILLMGVSFVWDFGVHFWAIMLLVMVAMAPTFTIRHQLRSKVQQFGILPTVPPEEVDALSEERLRKLPWSAVLAPGAALFYLALRMHPHLPPSDADDWTEIALFLAVAAVFLWAIVRKLIADRHATL